MKLPNSKTSLLLPLVAGPLVSLMCASTAQAGAGSSNRLDMLKAQAEVVRARSDASLKHAEAYLKAAAASVDWAKSRKLRQQGEWQHIELGELRRGVWFLGHDEYQARAVTKSLERRATELSAFFNGMVTPRNCQTFLWATRHIRYSASIREYLSAEVPRLSGDQFVSSRKIFTVLNPDGSLKPVPPILHSDDPDHPIEQARCAFADKWELLVHTLLYGGQISREQLSALETSLESWEKAAKNHTAGAPVQAQFVQSNYLRSLRRLEQCLYWPRQVELLRQAASEGGFGFPGGTCGQLLEHVQTFVLSVRPGTQAQLEFSQLGEQFLASLDEEIETQRKKVDQLTEQSPAKKAAIREAIVSGVSDRPNGK